MRVNPPPGTGGLEGSDAHHQHALKHKASADLRSIAVVVSVGHLYSSCALPSRVGGSRWWQAPPDRQGWTHAGDMIKIYRTSFVMYNFRGDYLLRACGNLKLIYTTRRALYN